MTLPVQHGSGIVIPVLYHSKSHHERKFNLPYSLSERHSKLGWIVAESVNGITGMSPTRLEPHPHRQEQNFLCKTIVSKLPYLRVSSLPCAGNKTSLVLSRQPVNIRSPSTLPPRPNTRQLSPYNNFTFYDC